MFFLHGLHREYIEGMDSHSKSHMCACQQLTGSTLVVGAISALGYRCSTACTGAQGLQWSQEIGIGQARCTGSPAVLDNPFVPSCAQISGT